MKLVAEQGGAPDPLVRDKLVRLWIDGEILRIYGLRTVAAAISGQPGPMASVRKALADPHGQDVFRIANELAGPAGMVNDAGPLGTPGGWWAQGFLFSPALTIGGGTSEVLRNVIGERILGLPREPDPDAGRSWREVKGGVG